MAITEFEVKGSRYWRIYRAWNGEPHQLYVPIGKNPIKSRKKAERIDEGLQQRQRAATMGPAYRLAYHINEKGQVRGIRRQVRFREGRKPVDEFGLRVNVPWEEQIRYTVISITKHGVVEAHRLAVQRYCDFYGFDERSEMRGKLLETLSAYQTPLNIKTVREDDDTVREDADFVESMQREIEDFRRRQKAGVIRSA